MWIGKARRRVVPLSLKTQLNPSIKFSEGANFLSVPGIRTSQQKAKTEDQFVLGEPPDEPDSTKTTLMLPEVTNFIATLSSHASRKDDSLASGRERRRHAEAVKAQ